MPFDFDARLAEWRNGLLDISLRNRLIHFSRGNSSGIELIRPELDLLWQLLLEGELLTFVRKHELLGLRPSQIDIQSLAVDYDPVCDVLPSPEEIDRELMQLCLNSPRLSPTHLVTEFQDEALFARLNRLRDQATEFEQNHGVAALYVVFGLLRWYDPERGPEPIYSPILLLPVRLIRASRARDADFALTAESDEPLVNHSLAELLRRQFGLALPEPPGAEPGVEAAATLLAYLREVLARVGSYRGWGVELSAALALLNFHKMAMWHDLGRNAGRIRLHPVCRALAGDASVSLAPATPLPAAAELDESVSPAASFPILDADSSQQEAIEAVKRSAHLVIDGPPGTGKSQTIANIIAEALAAGKTVLFVSEKVAAMEVVKRRLDQCGLGDFCLELHTDRANNREVLRELGRCLDLVAQGAPETDAELTELATVRRDLNEYVTELHTVRPPLGRSAYAVHGELFRLARHQGRSRLNLPDVGNKDAAFVQQAVEQLTRLRDCWAVMEEPGGHPWLNCKLSRWTPATADEVRLVVVRLTDALRSVRATAEKLTCLGLLQAPATVSHWRSAGEWAEKLARVPLLPPAWFRGDPVRTAHAVIELDRLTRSARELSAGLGEFDAAAVWQIAAPDELIVPSPCRRLRNDSSTTVRQQIGRLRELLGQLEPVRGLARELAEATRQICRHLRLSSQPSVRELDEWFALTARLARTSPVPPGWWSPTREAELSAVVARAAKERERQQELRVAWVSRYSPAALESESDRLTRRAARAAASLWHWLPWSEWARVRPELAVWSANPSAGGLPTRQDILRLAEYHALTESLRVIETTYPDELLHDETGETDWAATRTALADVRRLREWGAGRETAAVLGCDDAEPRREVARLAEAAGRRHAELVRLWRRLVVNWQAPPSVETLSVGPEELAGWLDQLAQDLTAEADAFERLARLLRPDQDLAVSAVPAKVRALQELVAVRLRCRAAAEQAGDDRPAREWERTDYRAAADRARALLAVTGDGAPPLTAAAAATLYDPAARDQLLAVVRELGPVREEFERAWGALTSQLFDPSATVSHNLVLSQTPLPELEQWTRDRAADIHRLAEWTHFLETTESLQALGLGEVLTELRGGYYPVAEATEVFLARFYQLWLNDLNVRVPRLGRFNRLYQEQQVERFVALDRLHVATAAQRVRERLLTTPARPRRRDNPPASSELGILQRELAKRSRRLPVRVLFQQIPRVLLRLKPCFMMSPLAVSTYLDTPDLTFDLVIFDEASQVRLPDAVCAIYRGRQLVVAGDPRQLPPTDFFTRGSGEDNGAEVGAGSESLLDVCLATGFTRRRLLWHYRSRREGLIAFSNRTFYDGRLMTFPSVEEGVGRAVEFHYVQNGRYRDGVNAVEAHRVAELVIEYARRNPTTSLGVIAFGRRQQDCIRRELDVLRRQHPETAEFFDENRCDPFFIKNLETVQGDERDVIILSVGYGPDDSGRVALRLGPLLVAGGERRLNVAVTRARQRMVVVASMTAADIDPDRTSAEGVRLLRAFLDYAQRGAEALPEVANPTADLAAQDAFADELARALTELGYTVHRNVGYGEFRVDLALSDPDQGGRYVLGIECDGRTYASGATARDRERLRRAVLEDLGWPMLRVWSAEGVHDPRGLIRRVQTACEAARRGELRRLAHIEVPQPRYGRPPLPSQPEPSPSSFTSAHSPTGDRVVLALGLYGAMNREDLMDLLSRWSGHDRPGPRVRERMAAELNSAVDRGLVTLVNDRVLPPGVPSSGLTT